MITQYPGGLITKNPVTPAGPLARNAAPGVWTMEEVAYWRSLNQWPTAGNVVLNTYTFPAGTSTWTAPATTIRLETAVGQGAAGTSDYADPNPSIVPGGITVSATNTTGAFGTLDWGTLYNLLTPYAGSGGIRTQTTRTTVWALGTNDRTTTSAPLTDVIYNLDQPVYGTTSVVAYRQFGGTLPPTSGQVLYSFFSTPGGGDAGFRLQVYYYYYGSEGAATTGFSLTFPGGAYSGGTGYPATPTTFTNVTVTPGATYTIVNNGSLTITYYT